MAGQHRQGMEESGCDPPFIAWCHRWASGARTRLRTSRLTAVAVQGEERGPNPKKVSETVRHYLPITLDEPSLPETIYARLI